ncbi:MAG: Streptomycin 6-kinase (Streptidine kinase) (Streptomycin 6-phosphotransferase) (APH(6)) [uncultured Thermomicrobiales bacterium]|uniref:Streptomycin 6-kinase (Streptidine kinase) (Streptomycin 6-phosphotransferase) (APH(6)) n=1 Tax=uncultured Thermomicrobiales bacterium TaxID=1645740 RepID=A0A6J4UV78_9BACT|nr:MAG: Streptomycin 6-kinase (Streptidine kinase) (Streptomycin 6-phosphotransferase) (APH(6)) [uncultured Thermomicrobiales bacterium]
MILPGAIEQTITAMHGEAGRAWLDDLPRRVAGYARRWQLTMMPPFGNLSFNYAAPGLRADGIPVVLKICYPGPEVQTEMAALRIAGGNGMVRLLAKDVAGATMLLQRAVPGDMLIDHPDDEAATQIAAGVMVASWRTAPEDHPFPTVAGWGRGFERMRARFDGGTGPLPADLTGRAERLFADLVASSPAPVVLHGDLHHYNILRDADGWLAIDPKGVAGEPAYEIGALMRNRLPAMADEAAGLEVLVRRLRIVAGVTGLDPERMRQWTVAQALLSAWWTIEDGGDIASTEDVIRTAEILERVTL